MATGERFGTIFEGGTALGLGSAELLGRFAQRRDEAAFAALVAHHGPMVLATCRRILPNGADADDAFQATFLVLARRAGAIGSPDRLAPWLHGVARRVSVRARSATARRRAVEREAPGEVAVAPPPADDAPDLRAVLDEELARLPEKYRAPLVLCYLEGLTHDQAAGLLSWPVGTVRSRLAGGRDRLRSRLARRGYAPGALAVVFPSTLPTVAVSHFLQAATVRLVFASSSTTAATSAVLLAQGVLTSMFLAKVQTAALAATMTIATVGVVAAQPRGVAEIRPVASVAPPALLPAPPDQPTPPQDLAKQLDAAQDRIKTLEAELAALKAKTPSTPTPPPAPPGGVPEFQPQVTKFPTIEELKARYPSTPAVPEPPVPPRPPSTSTITERIGDDPSRAATTTTSTYVRSADAPVTPPRTPPPPATNGRGSESRITATTSMAGTPQANPFGGSWVIPLNGKVLVMPPDRSRASVIDTATGAKAVYRAPEGAGEIMPVVVSDVIGLAFKGDKVTQLAAYSTWGNEWFTQDMVEPAPGNTIQVAAGSGLVRCLVGRRVYLFGANAKRWGVVELKQPPTDATIGTPGSAECVVIPDGDLIHTFNFKTGQLTHASLKDDK